MSQPIGASLRPGGVRLVAFSDTEVVGGVCIYVQLSRDTSSLEREVHDHAVLRRADDVVPTMHKGYRGRPGRNVEARSEFILVLRLQVAGIRRRCSLVTDPRGVCSSLVPSLSEKSLAANVIVFMFMPT
jgi:hypothetical protein